MKEKGITIIKKINMILIGFFLIVAPIYLGIYRDIFINQYLLYLTVTAFFYIASFLLKPHKVNKRYLLYFIFAVTFLIPIILGIGQYKVEAIKNIILLFLMILFVMNVIDTFKEKKDVLFKIIILSTVVTSIISMVSIFNNALFDNLHIAYGYSDFYSTSVYRLYGTFQYPNVLAVFNLIGIILCFSYLDQKKYNIALYLNILVLFLTMSKSILLFSIPVFFCLLKYHKKSYYHLIALCLPLLYNISFFRNSYINHDVIMLSMVTILLIGSYFLIYFFLNHYFKSSLSIIICILCLGVLFPTSSLYIKKSVNPIIITDFMNLPKNNIYKLSFDIKETNLNGQVLIKKLVLENHVMNAYIVGIADLNTTKEVYFKTVENSEYYLVELVNMGNPFTLKKLILQDSNSSQDIYLNYALYPYTYIKMFEQTKYDVGSLEGRTAIYQDCFKMIKDAPFSGNGFQYFKYYTNTNHPVHSAIEEHSYLLRVGVENGIFSMVVWFIILISMGIRIIRNFDEEHLPIVLIIGLIIFSSLYDFTLSFQYFLILLFLFDMLLDRKESKELLCICSAGGHLTAMMKLKDIIKKYDSVLITEKTVLSKNIEEFDTKYVYYCSKYYFFHYLCVLPFNFVKNIYYFLYYNPKMVITTGAHTGVFMCYLAKLCRRKVIFIEVFDRYKTLTLSGKFVYKIADVFIVQQKQLQEKYSNSIYIGGMF